MALLSRPGTGAAFALCCVLALTACGSDPKLSALESDPMAKATFPHTTLVDNHTQKSGTTLGKPISAEVLRVFQFSGVSASELIRQALTKAQDTGWKKTFRGPIGFKATKRTGGVDAILNVTAGGPSGASRFVIDLTSQQ
jgi:hypothetical protein